MKISKTKIIDERQETQNLQNSNIAYNVMIIMLCIFLLIQTFFNQRGFAYVGPEFITLLTGCLLKIILDIRQGNVYTKMNSKTRLTVIIYVGSAFAFGVFYGIRNYLLYDFEPWMIILVIIPIFVEMLILIVAVHFIYMKLSKRRLKKLEQKLDDDEFEE